MRAEGDAESLGVVSGKGEGVVVESNANAGRGGEEWFYRQIKLKCAIDAWLNPG